MRDQIVDEIEAFLVRTEMPPATFGRRVMSDPNFVFELRNGIRQELRTSTVDKLRVFMASYRPKRAGNESRAVAA